MMNKIYLWDARIISYSKINLYDKHNKRMKDKNHII